MPPPLRGPCRHRLEAELYIWPREFSRSSMVSRQKSWSLSEIRLYALLQCACVLLYPARLAPHAEPLFAPASAS